MSSDGLRYFEDFAVGEVVELGSYPPLSEAEIIDFARQWDPQPFHVDPERARRSIFGGLVASGWHTGAIAMRLLVDGLLSQGAVQGSPGAEHIRFRRPVRPGDSLSGRFTVLAASPSVTRPSLGKVVSLTELFNQNGEVVLSMEATTFYDRRREDAEIHQDADRDG
jgi:acyl dehydratase